MKITKKVNVLIEYTYDKNNVYCKGTRSFHFIWGAISNPFDVGIKTNSDGWYVIPKNKLKQRRLKLLSQKERIDISLKAINQTLKIVLGKEK